MKPRRTKATGRRRNHVEHSFSKLQQFRRIAACCDSLGANFLAFVDLASVRCWL
jgi:transposase